MTKPSRWFAPELNAKPLGIIMLRDDERDEFYGLSTAQKGYFLHWVRSNPGYTTSWWGKALRKAREQRPSQAEPAAQGEMK